MRERGEGEGDGEGEGEGEGEEICAAGAYLESLVRCRV